MKSLLVAILRCPKTLANRVSPLNIQINHNHRQKLIEDGAYRQTKQRSISCSHVVLEYQADGMSQAVRRAERGRSRYGKFLFPGAFHISEVDLLQCDEEKPTCSQCRKTSRACPGYTDVIFRDQTELVTRKQQKIRKPTRDTSKSAR